MPLILGQPSVERRKAFEAGLQQLVHLGRVPANLRVNPNPQPVYVLSLKDGISNIDVKQAAKLVSWRYSAGDVSGQAVVGDVSDAAPPTVTRLLYGDPAKKVLKGNEDLKDLPEVKANNFEACLLRIPGALVEGFWLKPANATNNGLFVPAGIVFGSVFQVSRPDSIDTFLNTLHPVAEATTRGENLPTTRA